MAMLLNRVVTGWNFKRLAYLGIGLWIIIQSALNGEWLGVVLGSWPTVMGLLGLACAGSCQTPNNN